MSYIDVIHLDSCSGHLIYIRKFQFQWNLRWSIFRPQYCEIWTSKWLWWVSVQGIAKILVPFFKFHQTVKHITGSNWNSNIDQIRLTLLHVEKITKTHNVSSYSMHISDFALWSRLKETYKLRLIIHFR